VSGTTLTPRHRAHSKDRVGGEEILLLRRVAGIIADMRVRDEVHVLATLGHIVLPCWVDTHDPEHSLPFVRCRVVEEKFLGLLQQIGKRGFWRNSSAKETSLSKSV
jgi:hypothetical protein